VVATLLTVAALFSYLNHRFLRLPTTIGLMLIGLATSLALLAAGNLLPQLEARVVTFLARIDFDKTLMDGLLGFLLFAGALHVDLNDLLEQKLVIGLLATLSLLISTFLVGGAVWLMLGGFGMPQPFLVCLLFGALISPTDPIAVLGVLKALGAPRALEIRIAGESLFNDGVAVVIFLGVLAVAGLGSAHGAAPHGAEEVAATVAGLFALETLGGLAFGFAAGFGAYLLMRSVDSYSVEILLSVALVAGGYSLAQALHVSAPLAMVVAGLFIGNRGRHFAMSESSRAQLDTFWKLIDEILNAVLFVLIGLELLVIPFEPRWLGAGLLVVPVVLAARWVAVSIPVHLLRPLRGIAPHAIKVLTWGGLRGGISVALALSLKEVLGARNSDAYEGLLIMTYVVVVFSIGVQGLSMAPVLRVLGLGPGR
jgi:CPA1 family monovalent cation:H+ antiporter